MYKKAVTKTLVFVHRVLIYASVDFHHRIQLAFYVLTSSVFHCDLHHGFIRRFRFTLCSFCGLEMVLPSTGFVE